MASGLGAIILAAGFSSRMGALKALLPMGRSTLLGQCVELLRQGGITDIVVVNGYRAAEVAAETGAHGARPVHNPHFKEGMFSSIRAGMQGLDAAAARETVFVLPVDMPLVRPGTVRLLAQAMDKRRHPALEVAHPVFQGQRGHPLCIRARLLRRLCREDRTAGGLHPLLTVHEQACPARVGEVMVADANILFDLDTPGTYDQGCALFTRLGYPTEEEAEVIVRHIHPMPAKGIAHGRMVGALAAGFAAAINQRRGSELVPELCRVGGLLHDVAKGQANHEEQGALWLSRLGFPRVAAIVAAHRDLDWQPGVPLSERELVHLADKVVRGNRVVAIDTRFAEKLAAYAHDPEAQAAICRRHTLAKRLARAVEEASGYRLDILSAQATGAHAAA